MCELCIFLGNIAVIITAKACGQEGGAGGHMRSPLRHMRWSHHDHEGIRGLYHSRLTLKGQNLHEPWLDKVHQERKRHNAERRGQFSGFTTDDLDEGIEEHACAYAVGDAVREGHSHNGGQGRKTLLEITKRDLAHDATHEIADDYERASRGLRWHDSRQGTEKQCQKEPACRDQGGETSAPTDGDTCRTPNIGGGGTGSSHTSKDSPQ